MDENQFIALLHRSWTGQLDADAEQRLREALANDAGLSGLAVKCRAIWDDAASPAYTPAFDPEEQYAQLRRRLGLAESSAAALKTAWVRKLRRIAAVLVLAIAGIWVFRTVLSTPAATMVHSSVAEKEVIDLPDGSRVWLRQSATLEYPAVFARRERRLILSGEAYFEVAPGKPFRVYTAQGDLVEVLGTGFGIRPMVGGPGTEVMVRHGRVRFTPSGSPEGVELTAQEKVVYDKRAERMTVHRGATLNELAWQTGGLEFVATPLAQVVADLEAYYRVSIELRNLTLAACRHTAPRTSQPIEKVLETLALTYRLRVTETAPGRYVLDGGSCN